MRPIRVSTGWSFVSEDITKSDQERIGQLADGLEFSATSPERVAFYESTEFDIDSVSLHLTSPSSVNFDAFNRLSQYDFDAAVVHMDASTDVLTAVCENADDMLPLTFENLDDRHSNPQGKLDAVYKQLDCEFTIDIQHLAENYPVKEAIYVITACSERVKQFHVSGRTGTQRHVLVHQAANKSKIVELLKHISTFDATKNVPWVIEGKYETVADVSKELDYLRSIQAEPIRLGEPQS